MSGPATLETPKTAPNRPLHLPRSRGGTTSPIAACALTMRPPPPRPWIARNAISSVIPCASPHSAEPIRKITSAACRTILRPKRSPSFPYSGVTTVTASRYAVTTQDRCSRPPSSSTIVGSAVETIVWSSDASSITSISPDITTHTRGRCCAITCALATDGLGDTHQRLRDGLGVGEADPLLDCVGALAAGAEHHRWNAGGGDECCVRPVTGAGNLRGLAEHVRGRGTHRADDLG